MSFMDSIPTSPLFWLAFGSIGLGLTLILYLVFHPGMQYLGLLQMNGLVLLKQKPNFDSTLTDIAGSEIEFEKQYQLFVKKYDKLKLKLDLSGDAMRLEIQTHKNLPVIQTGILERFCRELQTLLDPLPAEKYFIKVQIEGRISSLLKSQTFTIASHDARIGLHSTESKRFSLKGYFFNG